MLYGCPGDPALLSLWEIELTEFISYIQPAKTNHLRTLCPTSRRKTEQKKTKRKGTMKTKTRHSHGMCSHWYRTNPNRNPKLLGSVWRRPVREENRAG